MTRASPPRLAPLRQTSWKTSRSLPGAPALWPLLAVLRRLDSVNWSHLQLILRPSCGLFWIGRRPPPVCPHNWGHCLWVRSTRARGFGWRYLVLYFPPDSGHRRPHDLDPAPAGVADAARCCAHHIAERVGTGGTGGTAAAGSTAVYRRGDAASRSASAARHRGGRRLCIVGPRS